MKLKKLVLTILVPAILLTATTLVFANTNKEVEINNLEIVGATGCELAMDLHILDLKGKVHKLHLTYDDVEYLDSSGCFEDAEVLIGFMITQKEDGTVDIYQKDFNYEKFIQEEKEYFEELKKEEN